MLGKTLFLSSLDLNITLSMGREAN